MTVSPTPHASKRSSSSVPSLVIQSDASKKGWGVVCNRDKIGGRWSPSEAIKYNNILELQVAMFGLKSFAEHKKGYISSCSWIIQLLLHYINNMGRSHSQELDNIAQELWEWSFQREIWISAVQIPGISNVDADDQSRNFNDKHGWALNCRVFYEILEKCPGLDIDLFATRLNHKPAVYCSWKPDPGCSFVDAFSFNWNPYKFYAFPPFSLIPRCLQKINHDKATRVLIVPVWPTQPWFPLPLQQLHRDPWIPNPDKKLLQHPGLQEPHHGIMAVRYQEAIHNLH